MNTEKQIEISKNFGFEHVSPMSMETVKFLPEVRDMCAADRCNHYAKSWACPPACGTLEEIEEKAKAYSTGIIVQTVGTREDPFDFEAIANTEEIHQKRFIELTDNLRDSGEKILPMSAGVCKLCSTCTYPENPCRFPDRMITSIEAYGIFVSQLCKDNGVSYYYGNDAICFTSCILFK